ncbi:MAG: glutathione S-transferase [Robiginitomaculum sp.]|nr:MAG: glutathione S-transferase [Robiginitomaculum sp.]
MSKLNLDDCLNSHCPWSGDPVREEGLVLYHGNVVGFCNPGCREKFERATNLFDAVIGRSED